MKNRPDSNWRCWFCRDSGDSGEMAFSYEFDTPLHLECLRAALLVRDDLEIRLMAEEFGLLEDFTPDTDTPMTHVELAREMDRFGTPCVEDESAELSVDLDDYPLF